MELLSENLWLATLPGGELALLDAPIGSIEQIENLGVSVTRPTIVDVQGLLKWLADADAVMTVEASGSRSLADATREFQQAAAASRKVD